MHRNIMTNNMPLVYANQDENCPQITTMLRKTKRDESRLIGANKRPALAAINNNIIGSNDLGKQIQQRQKAPFSVRVDTKKPSPKQKQLSTRSQRTTCTARPTSRQSTLHAFSAHAAAAASFSTAKTSGFRVFTDKSASSSQSCQSSAKPSTFPRLKAEACPMSVEKPMGAPLAPPRSRKASSLSITMDIEESCNDMSFDIPCLVEEKPAFRNIDADADVNESPEYAEEIDTYLRKCEHTYRIRANYMARQKDIKFEHRSTVVDWMFDVCNEFHLGQKTFQLAVSYLDRFLSKMSISRLMLQLVGTAAMFIAYKVEEIEPRPGLAATFCWYTDNTYRVSQLFKMEQLILEKLGYEVNSTTTSSFQERFLKASDSKDCRESYFVEYLCDRSLVTGVQFLKYAPSMVTAAAVGLARSTFRPEQNPWSPTLAHYTKYSYSDLSECMTDLLNMYKTEFATDQEKRFGAVWNKYSLARYMLILQRQPLTQLSTAKPY